jgi:glucose-6-phosphate isomerase
VQQLRDGVPNFFATFIEVARDRAGGKMEVEPGFTSGDYLHGFLRGTRAALHENGRESITISIPEVNAFSVGALIALFERAVGFYGSLINVNAYHQPGVEAGKKAATRLLELQGRVLAQLPFAPGKTADEIARALGADPEDVFHALHHAAANDSSVRLASAEQPAGEKFYRKK